jgi:hypothetical protein
LEASPWHTAFRRIFWQAEIHDYFLGRTGKSKNIPSSDFPENGFSGDWRPNMDPTNLPPRIRAGIAAVASILILILIPILIPIGCGAASGDRADGNGGNMREPGTSTPTLPLPEIDRSPPAETRTATFAMG